jgi:hypothetical protein
MQVKGDGASRRRLPRAVALREIVVDGRRVRAGGDTQVVPPI